MGNTSFKTKRKWTTAAGTGERQASLSHSSAGTHRFVSFFIYYLTYFALNGIKKYKMFSIYLEETEMYVHTKVYTWMFRASWFYIWNHVLKTWMEDPDNWVFSTASLLRRNEPPCHEDTWRKHQCEIMKEERKLDCEGCLQYDFESMTFLTKAKPCR